MKKQHKWKHLGIRITEDAHEEFFAALKTASKVHGRNVSAAEVLVPAIRDFIRKAESQK